MKKLTGYVFFSVVGAILTIGSVYIYNPLSLLINYDTNFDGYGIPYPFKNMSVESKPWVIGQHSGANDVITVYYGITPFLFDWVVLSLVAFAGINYLRKSRLEKALANKSGLVCDNCGAAVLAEAIICPSCGEAFDETDETDVKYQAGASHKAKKGEI